MMFALCWTAHNGSGAPYVALTEDDARDAGVTSSLDWSRRDGGSLPGASEKVPGMYYVAKASGMPGVYMRPGWDVIHGPEGFPANNGKPIWLGVEI